MIVTRISHNTKLKTIIAFILALILTISAVAMSEIPLTKAESEANPPNQVLKSVTNEHMPVPHLNAYVVQMLLEKGDQVKGYFSVSNIHYFPNLPHLNLQAEVVVRDPNGQTVYGIYSASAASFNFTAQQSGVYTFLTGSNLLTELIYTFHGYGLDSINQFEAPELTLNYKIIWQPLKLGVLSPTNQIYNDANVSLGFSVNRFCNWVGYRLDDADVVSVWTSNCSVSTSGLGYPNDNITIPASYGNTTLTNLSTGTHTLTLHANDTYGNTGNQTVVFTVGPSTPASSLLTLLLVVVMAVVLGVLTIILFYRRHRKQNLPITG